jgi:hypothetical protein
MANISKMFVDSKQVLPCRFVKQNRLFNFKK